MGKVTATATNVNVNTLADRKSEYYRVKLNPNKRCKESSGAQAAPEKGGETARMRSGNAKRDRALKLN